MEKKGITSAVKEKCGKHSLMRWTNLLWSVGVLIVWAGVSLMTGVLQPLPESIVVILGVLTTGKVTQRVIENKETKVE